MFGWFTQQLRMRDDARPTKIELIRYKYVAEYLRPIAPFSDSPCTLVSDIHQRMMTTPLGPIMWQRPYQQICELLEKEGLAHKPRFLTNE